ncbi:MAG: serine hydrolase [Balneolia bacterium]|nr:serine hydrolase [Balneolia bacterium]
MLHRILASGTFRKQLSRIAVFMLALAFSAGAVTTGQAQESEPGPLLPPGLDAYIENGMDDWGIPGMAVSIVKDDSLIYSRGFGFKKLGELQPVDDKTLFGVASTTKAFTATALAMLVEEGKLDWDDPITKYLPDFRLYDPYVTESITIRDALSHRSGLGRMTGNRIQYMPFRDREELLYRMRYMEPEAPFRDRYVYSNMMYMVAGEVVRAVSGMSWDEFIAERIFEPLGMSASNTSITQFAENSNAAWPHQEIEGEIVPIPRRNFDNVGASASINTSAYEMAQWMRLHLGTAGEYNGNQIIGTNVLNEIYRPVTATPGGNRENPISAYGLGWTISSWEGRTIYRHGGATDGMNTNLILIPEENVGIFITTNTFNSFMSALGRHLKDFYTDVPERDWHNTYLNSFNNRLAAVLQLRQEIHDARVSGTSPSHSLFAYTGEYHDPLYDNVEVKQGDNGLELHFWNDETQIADLEHWHYDTFRAVWRNPAQREKFVWFQMGEDGQPEVLHVRFTLRPMLLQAGIYPTNYYRVVEFRR